MPWMRPGPAPRYGAPITPAMVATAAAKVSAATGCPPSRRGPRYPLDRADRQRFLLLLAPPPGPMASGSTRCRRRGAGGRSSVHVPPVEVGAAQAGGGGGGGARRSGRRSPRGSQPRAQLVDLVGEVLVLPLQVHRPVPPTPPARLLRPLRRGVSPGGTAGTRPLRPGVSSAGPVRTGARSLERRGGLVSVLVVAAAGKAARKRRCPLGVVRGRVVGFVAVGVHVAARVGRRLLLAPAVGIRGVSTTGTHLSRARDGLGVGVAVAGGVRGGSRVPFPPLFRILDVRGCLPLDVSGTRGSSPNASQEDSQGTEQKNKSRYQSHSWMQHRVESLPA